MMTQKDWVEVTTSLLGGAGIGAALMYLLDPESGHERREHIARRAGDAWETASDTARHTAEGVASGVSGLTDRARHWGEDAMDYGRETGRWASKRTRGMMPARSYFHRESESHDYGTIALAAVGALALGAGLMYVLDPQSGRRRRALIRDKAVHYAHEAGDAATGTAKDLRNRAAGVYHEARKAVSGGSHADSGKPQTAPVTSPYGSAAMEGECPPSSI